MTRWVEVADGVYQGRYQPLDVSVCVVRGADGLLVVDTRSSPREADEIIDDLRALGPGLVRWVVNTHAHYDHAFGNQRFGPGSRVDVPIYGHQRVPAHLDEYERPMLARWLADRVEPLADWQQVVITPPTVLVGDHMSLDLGDRAVDLFHLGRGHTDNDLVLHVPDAATWLVGDLVEESGPPMYGSGSFPLEWPGTVAVLRLTVEPGATFVPGHGSPVDEAFVARQNAALQRVARLITELHAAGVPVDEAVAAGGDRWPFPTEGLHRAVEDGYRQLDRPAT